MKDLIFRAHLCQRELFGSFEAEIIAKPTPAEAPEESNRAFLPGDTDPFKRLQIVMEQLADH